MTKMKIYSALLMLALYPTTAVLANNSDHAQVAHKSCRVSNEQAIARTKDFLKKINLIPHSSPVMRDLSLSNVDYPGIRNLKDVSYTYPDGKMEVRFYIGCESGEVENFDDFKYWEDNFPYSAKKEPSECKSVIESLARQIGIPSDMHFEKMERDWRKGIWVGEFVRIKDGYRYELDNVAIGISDKTRKLAVYHKIYFGKSCPTETKIKKEEAIKMAATEFHKFIFGKAKSHPDKIYARNEQLLIVQPDRPGHLLSVGHSNIANPPLKEKPSRLAWVIRYDFTGGIKNLKYHDGMSEEERQVFGAHLSERENLLHKYRNPIESFEMRIDAATGEILHVSHKDPQYYYNQWLSPKPMR
jgi:hypothetical protein